MTAVARVNRIALLIAELSRRARSGAPLPSLAQLVDWTGLERQQLQADLRVLQDLNESAEADWFLSLRAYLTSDEVMITSGGPYRRPVRPTPDEAMALAVGLAAGTAGATAPAEKAANAIKEFLAPHGPEDPPPFALDAGAGPGSGVIDATLLAIRSGQTLAIEYAGANQLQPTRRVIHPHRVVTGSGVTVIVAWCELRNDWRRFRTDRILEVTPAEAPYVARTEIPEELFVPPEEGVDEVTVRFTPRIARWLRERYPHGTDTEDGGLIVTYLCADAGWLVSEVLQYGAEAEVIGPPDYRAMMRRAVGG